MPFSPANRDRPSIRRPRTRGRAALLTPVLGLLVCILAPAMLFPAEARGAVGEMTVLRGRATVIRGNRTIVVRRRSNVDSESRFSGAFESVVGAPMTKTTAAPTIAPTAARANRMRG